MAVSRIGNNVYFTQSGEEVKFTMPTFLVGIYAFGVADGVEITVSLITSTGTVPIWSGTTGTWQTSGSNYLTTGRIAGNDPMKIPIPPAPGGIKVTANPPSGIQNGRIVCAFET